MSKRSESGQDAALARTEALLYEAAEFSPAENAPEGLAVRALARWEAGGRDCSPRLKVRFVPVLTVALAGMALLCLLSRPGSESLPPLVAQAEGEMFPSPFPLTNLMPSFAIQQKEIRKEAGNQPETYPRRMARLARHLHPHRSLRSQTPPKALWTVETVETRQIGVLYSVMTTENETTAQDPADAQAGLLRPAILSIPLQSQVRSCESPSVSPFPILPATERGILPQKAEPTYPEIITPNPSEEKTEP